MALRALPCEGLLISFSVMKIPYSIVNLLSSFMKRPFCRSAVAVVTCGLMTVVTFAQDGSGVPTAPLPGAAPSAKGWVWYMLAGLLFAIVTAVSIKPGKRTHQD